MRRIIKTIQKIQKEKSNRKSNTILKYTRCYKYHAIVSNRIIFESFHGKNISDSPLFMLKEFLKREGAEKYEIFYSTNDYDKHKEIVEEWGLPVKLVIVDTPEYAEILATAKYLVNNSSFPQWFIKKQDQVYIQTWHGVPLKALGKRMRLGIESMYNVQHNFLHADYITFPNEFTKEAIMRDYNLNDLFTGKVAMLGYPRNDIFHDRTQEKKIKSRFKIDGKDCFAYMPTWRGTSNHSLNIEGYRTEMKELLDYLDKMLGDNQVLYVNFHSMLEGKIEIEGYNHIKGFPKDINNYEFLNAMDALITDYSSVFFDYSVTGKPILLYTYDLEEYIRDRGLYLDIKEMPFPQFNNKEELADYITSGAYTGIEYMSTDYINKFIPYESANNSARAIDLLMGKEPEGVEIIDYSHNKEKKWNYLKYNQIPNEKFLDDVCKNVDPKKDILLLPRNSFGESMSAYLHDNFRDCFNFIFMRNDITLTYRERIMMKFREEEIQNRLKKRDENRIFADLNVNEKNNSICSGIPGSYCQISDIDTECLHSRVYIIDNRLVIEFDSFNDYSLENIIVANRKWCVVWSKHISLEEAVHGRIECDLSNVLLSDLIKLKDRWHVVLTARDFEGRLKKLFVAPKDIKRTELCDGIIDTIKYNKNLFTVEELEATRFLRANQSEFYSLTVVANAKTGNLQIISNYGLHDISSLWHGKIEKISLKKRGDIRLKATIDNFGSSVKGVYLRYRSTDERIMYPVSYCAQTNSSKHTITVEFNLKDYEFREVHWDLIVCLEYTGTEKYIKLKCDSRCQNLKFRIRDRQVRLDNGMTVLAYQTMGGNLAFTYREISPYETSLLRIKEICAILVYYLLYPYWVNRKIWIVYEKFCKMAQDNGYYFFEYCMENEENKKHIYYIIDSNAKDYSIVKKYGKNVIEYMSFRHILYLMVARIYIGSDSKSHVYVWRSRPSYVYDIVRRRKIFFLQHGVTAMKRVDYLFGKQGSSPMTYFATTSVNEQAIVTKYFGYKIGNAPINGFARWDALSDKSDRSNPKILVMPTWRVWLDDASEETFLTSDYFRVYSSLIQSSRLEELLTKNNAKLIFYIHPKLSAHLSLFTSNNPRVELIEQGSQKLNQIMMESSMIITDYSSVAWDMLYMSKPVVYYQFDQDRYLTTTGSYIDFNTELPGDVCYNELQLFDAIQRVAENGWKLTPDAIAKCKDWFYKKDKENSKRTFKYLKQKGY